MAKLMYLRFIGNNSIIQHHVFMGNNVKIYGSSRIGSNTFIDNDVVIGYPTRAKIVKALGEQEIKGIDEIFDKLSNGALIGNSVLIRRRCIVYEDVNIEDSVEFGHNVVIREKTSIMSGCRIGTNTILDGNIVIGTNTVIQSGVYIPPGVRIGRNVFIAPRVVFTNDRYPPSKRLSETVIDDDVVIGANAVIVAGIVIGRGAVIAAGAIVTKSVNPYTVVAGAPAKPIMTREEYEQKKSMYEENYRFPYR